MLGEGGGGRDIACPPVYGGESSTTLTIATSHLHHFTCTGECISGIGPVVAPFNYIGHSLQVIIPSFQFNDSGKISAFHLVGICGGAEGGVVPSVSDNVGCINILQVWRPLGGDGFSIAANFTATLPVPFAMSATASMAVAEPIPFSSGDVLGFSPGPNTGLFFEIAATSSQQPASHTYYTYNSFATELSATGNRVVASPIISVEGKYVTHEALTLYVDMRFKVIVSLAATVSSSAPLLPHSHILLLIDVMLISSYS